MESSAKYIRRLKSITKDCRPDMHEPDEQSVSAYVHGEYLDNAFGNDASSGEFVVGIENENGHVEFFNLATMIAIIKNIP